MVTNTSEPFDSANEADVAEQQQGMDGAGTVDRTEVGQDEASEADILDQDAHVEPDPPAGSGAGGAGP